MSQHRTPLNQQRLNAQSFVTNPAGYEHGGNFEFRYNGRSEYGSPSVMLDSEDHTEYPQQREQRYTWPERTATGYAEAARGDYDWFNEPVTMTTPPEAPLTPQSAPVRRGGAHRLPAPPAALKGRAAVVAVAAGAVVAAGQAALTDAPGSDPATSEISLDAASTSVPSTAVPQAVQFVGDVQNAAAPAAEQASKSSAPQVLNVAAPADLGQFTNLLSKGQKFAQERAAEETAKMRPLFSTFSTGTFTSGFGARWGTQHLGVDLANAIGTPILAVADGTVIDAGPAQGFGMWVRLKHADGTITVYGHIDSATVAVGQHVMAGDEIAKMGNRGFSTGPHCHFEVWLNGTDKIDPLPWLASRGISLGVERD